MRVSRLPCPPPLGVHQAVAEFQGQTMASGHAAHACSHAVQREKKAVQVLKRNAMWWGLCGMCQRVAAQVLARDGVNGALSG